MADKSFTDLARDAVAGLDPVVREVMDPTEVRHACPECPVGYPKPLCPVCLGAGLVTDRRLRQYEADQWRESDV